MKKVLSLLVALTLLVSSVGAFAEDTTLQVWFASWVSPAESEQPQENWLISGIVKEFEESHPGVKVDMVYFSDQQILQSRLRAAVLAGEAPDLANIYSGFVVNSLQDVLLDITDDIPEADKQDLTGWASVEVDGRYLGYPISVNEASGLMYNKEIVASAGVELEGENAPKNAEELWTALEKIAATGKEVFISGAGGYNALYVFTFSAWWSQLSGVARITSDSLAQTKFSDDEGFKTSVQYAADCYKNGFINKDYESASDPLARFINGEGAFTPTTQINPDAYEAMGDNLGIYMFPDYSADVAFPGFQIGGAGQALCPIKTTENKDLAIEFMSFISNHENNAKLSSGRGFSLRKDVTLDELGFTGKKIFEDYLQLVNTHTFNWNDNSMQSDVMNEFYKLSTMAITGQITVDECAAQLDQIAQDVADNA